MLPTLAHMQVRLRVAPAPLSGDMQLLAFYPRYSSKSNQLHTRAKPLSVPRVAGLPGYLASVDWPVSLVASEFVHNNVAQPQNAPEFLHTRPNAPVRMSIVHHQKGRRLHALTRYDSNVLHQDRPREYRLSSRPIQRSEQCAHLPLHPRQDDR